MLGGVPDDRHDDHPDKKFRQPEALPRRLQGTDQDLALDRDERGRHHEDAQSKSPFPTRLLEDLRHRIENIPVRPQGEHKAEDVGQEQDRRNPQTHLPERHLAREDRRSHIQGRHHESDDGHDEHRDLRAGGLSGKQLGFVAQAAREHAETEDQESVPDDRSRQRRLHDLREPPAEGEDRDDQLGRVPEGRVQKSTDPGTGKFAQLFRGEPEEPGQWHDRDPGDREHDDSGSEDDVEDPAHGDEHAQEDGPGVGAERAEVHRAGKRPTVLNLADNV